GTSVTFWRTRPVYTVLDSLPGTYLPAVAVSVLSAADDSIGIVPLSIPIPTAQGATNALQVCTNGFITLSATIPTITGTNYGPARVKFEAFVEPTMCGPWYDWSPNAGGEIVYEEVGGIMYVPWVAVQAYAVATTDTFQYQFDL